MIQVSPRWPTPGVPDVQLLITAPSMLDVNSSHGISVQSMWITDRHKVSLPELRVFT